MPDKSIFEILKYSFPPADKKSWQKAATLEIDGKNPNEELAWTSNDLAFLAYYDKNDVSDFSKQSQFQLSPSTDPFREPRAWINMPCIEVVDEMKANANALSQLATGADGILFDIRNHTQTNFDLLLNQIDWAYCSVSFRANTNQSISASLSKYIQQKKYDPGALTGAVFCDDEIQKNDWRELNSPQLKKIQMCGLIINSSSPTKEISEALLKGVHLLDRLTENGTNVATAIRNIAFSFPISTNFFLEIAKLKALRQLWFQIARSYQQDDYQSENLHLHVRSEAWKDASFQPNANMLKSSTASLAAVLGGCNSLTVHAEEDNLMMNRMARNISNVLREESQIDKVSDATAGAYAVEKMTDEMAQASWLDFQNRIKPS